MVNAWADDHPAALFICLMDKTSGWQCAIETGQVECDPNTVLSTSAYWIVYVHYLERVEVENWFV